MNGAQIPTSAGGINNPGNFRKSDVGWLGKIDNPGSGFEGFANIADGYRIIIKQYRTDYENGMTTLNKIIANYAPANDGNDPVAYAANIASALGISPDDDVKSILWGTGAKVVMKAVTQQEQGSAWMSKYFNQADIDAAYNLL